MKEARVKTKSRIKLWVFLACLAFSLASLQRMLSQRTLNLLQAARSTLAALTSIRLVRLMSDCEKLSQTLRQPLKLIRV